MPWVLGNLISSHLSQYENVSAHRRGIENWTEETMLNFCKLKKITLNIMANMDVELF